MAIADKENTVHTLMAICRASVFLVIIRTLNALLPEKYKK